MTLAVPQKSVRFAFVHAVAKPIPVPSTAREDDDQEPDERPSPRPARYVLVVEDDSELCDVIKQELTDCGYRVLCATNGVEALAIVRREYMRPQRSGDAPRLPGVVLLDVHLPPGDPIPQGARPTVEGWNVKVAKEAPRIGSSLMFFAQFRAMPAMADVPVIIMSDSQSISSFQKWAISTEGLDVPRGEMPKPFALGELLEKVAASFGLPGD